MIPRPLLVAALVFLPSESLTWDTLLPTVYDARQAEHGAEYYAYAPAVVDVGDRDVVFVCANTREGEIRDHIVRFERDHATNRVVTAPVSVLEGSPPNAITGQPRWDSMHTCDPAVVRGSFGFRGHAYRYALFYTGNPIDGSEFNQVGVAFADDLRASSWTKLARPIVEVPFLTTANGDSTLVLPLQPHAFFWGFGQPSVTAVAGGRVLLTYTRGLPSGTSTEALDLDLADAEHPVVRSSWSLPTTGLTEPNGANASVLRNVDVAFDTTTHRFYIVRDGDAPTDHTNPDFLATNVQVASMAEGDFWSGTGSWRPLGSITTYPRNHDAGLAKNEWGMIVRSGQMRVLFSTSCADGSSSPCTGRFDRPEWSYALAEMDGTIRATLW